MARWLYRLICALKLPIAGSRQVEKDLRQLYPGKPLEQLVADYYVKKIALALTVCVVGVILGVAVGVNAENGRLLKEGSITRGSYREEAVELEVSTVLEGGEEEHFSIMVEPRKLPEEEAQLLYEELVRKLPTLVLGDNASLEAVTEHLVLEEQFEDYPFAVEWTSARPDILTGSGKVTAVEQAEEVSLKAKITYGELEWEAEFSVCVVPKILSPQEQEAKELAELLQASEKESRSDTEWHLPETYQNRPVVWEQVLENNSMLFIIGAMGVAVLLFLLSDKDLHDELEEKRRLMKRAYPDVVQKLALYLGAGLTVRAAFQRMAAEYEEIQYTCRELQAGVSESIAYEHLAKRIGTQEYLRLSTLLVQNLKKGNSTLLQRLREEADRAAVEKMQNCRKLGEEAATKLLVPMVLFLVVVMVMIMLPAFSSMGV